MPKFIDLTGKRFGRLEVKRFSHIDQNKKWRWSCDCDCGGKAIIAGDKLKNGHTQSCGCYRSEVITKHGCNKTRLYRIWNAIKNRCYNPNTNGFHNYGGRGIAICDKWKQNSVAFFNWARESGYDCGLTIERINNDGNYEPSNCKWSTPKEQARNRRTNVNITIMDETFVLMDIVELFGIPHGTMRDRMKNNWSFGCALLIPSTRGGPKEKKRIADFARNKKYLNSLEY